LQQSDLNGKTMKKPLISELSANSHNLNSDIIINKNHNKKAAIWLLFYLLKTNIFLTLF